MKKITLFICCSLFLHVVSAQITTGELPLGFDPNIIQSLKSVPLQSLSTPDMAQIDAKDQIYDDQPGPLRFAYPVPVNYTLTNSGQWQTLDDRSKLWRLKVRLPGALSTNALYDAFWLPEGAKFFVYSEETRQSIGAIFFKKMCHKAVSKLGFRIFFFEHTMAHFYHHIAQLANRFIV